MKNLKTMQKQSSTVLFLLILLIADQNANSTEAFNAIELHARHVDRAALQSQDAASNKLKLLVQKYRGKVQEPLLLMRLAQVYQEGAGIEFRISTHRNPSGSQLKHYKERLTLAIQTVDQLMHRFPDFMMMDQALFIRGQAKEELDNKMGAKEDYLKLTSKYPTSQHALAAYMALADIASANNKHAEAVQYLTPIQQAPGSPQYPFALYKLAWSHFNLENIPKALDFLTQHIRFYDAAHRRLSSSDQALRENSLQDVATFYFEGYERDHAQFSIHHALSFFENLKPGPIFGKMIVRFAKLLRSRLRNEELLAWKNLVIQEKESMPEAMEVVLTLFDHEWNQYHYPELAALCKDIQKLHRPRAEPTDEDLALTNLAEKAEKLQAIIVKSAGQEHNPQTQLKMKVLGEIYTTLIQILPERDPKIAISHYNLAETLFKMNDFELATEHYYWILDHWHKKFSFKKTAVQLKAIASRYETFRARKVIPEQLKPTILASYEDQPRWNQFQKELPSKIRDRFVQWVDLIDEVDSDSLQDPKDILSLENFLFEANRTIYSLGGLYAALERFTEFSENHPKSKYAIPSQELVLDTAIVSQNWTQTLKLTRNFKKHAVANTAFYTKLDQLAADASYKVLEGFYQKSKKITSLDKPENKKAFDQLDAQFREEAQSYLKDFSHESRAADVLFLLATSSQGRGNLDDTLTHLNDILVKHPESALRSEAQLARARIELTHYQWVKAGDDFEAYLHGIKKIPKASAPSEKEIQKLWSQVLLLRWIAKREPLACEPIAADAESTLGIECQRYQALSSLKTGKRTGKTELQWKKVRELALKGPQENRTLWALIDLKWNPDLSLREELQLSRAAAKSWENISSEVRLTLVPDLNTTLIKALTHARVAIQRANPMNRPSPKAVTTRADWIKELEETVTKIQKLPWYRIQSGSMRQLAEAYDEFITNLVHAKIPDEMTPEDRTQYTQNIELLVQPFSKKRDEIAMHAIRIALEANIEQEDRQSLINRFPQLAAQVTQELSKKDGNALAQNAEGALTQLLTSVRHSKAQLSSKKKDPTIESWKNGFKSQSWEECAILLQEMTSKKLLPEDQLKILRAATLAAQGAQSEALVELQGTSLKKGAQIYEL